VRFSEKQEVQNNNIKNKYKQNLPENTFFIYRAIMPC